MKALLVALMLAVSVAQGAADVQVIGGFSAMHAGDALPSEWRPTTLPRIERHTRYTLVNDNGLTVLRAESDRSMSSLLRRVDIDPLRQPWLGWRWRVDRLVEKSSLYSRDSDDFSARLYVLFDLDLGQLPFLQRTRIRIARALYGDDLPLAALCYVWATSEPVGTSAWNAFTDRVRVIVVASGAAHLEQWLDFERDVAADYRAAFGGEPPRISGIAIASDSDNTGGKGIAYFGDIRFAAAPQLRRQ